MLSLRLDFVDFAFQQIFFFLSLSILLKVHVDSVVWNQVERVPCAKCSSFFIRNLLFRWSIRSLALI